MSFEEPFHLQFEAVDHPLVLRLHVLDVQDLFQLLKPGGEIQMNEKNHNTNVKASHGTDNNLARYWKACGVSHKSLYVASNFFLRVSRRRST